VVELLVGLVGKLQLKEVGKRNRKKRKISNGTIASDVGEHIEVASISRLQDSLIW